MTKCKKRKWEILNNNFSGLDVVGDDIVCTVTFTTQAKMKANAEFICRAGNNFEELLEACKALTKIISPYIYKMGVKKAFHELVALESAKTAIAQAEVKVL